MNRCPHGPQCASNVYYSVCWHLYCMWPTVKRNEPTGPAVSNGDRK